MLSATTWTILGLAAVGLAWAAIRFYQKQNRGHGLGGGISRPKGAWLFFTVFTWFAICPAIAADPRVALPLRVALGLFGASMWIRGLAELYLLYVAKCWKPPMGIGHDVFCILLIPGVLSGQSSKLHNLTPLDRWVVAFVVIIISSLLVEIVYAAFFYRAVRGHTTGELGLWFADQQAPRFRRINQLTVVLNTVLYTALGAFLAGAAGLLPSP